MSRLGEQFRLTDTGRYVPHYKPIGSLAVTRRWEDDHVKRMKVFELVARFAVRVNMPDNISQASRNEKLMAAEVVHQASQTMLREVFGEFETPIREALLAAGSCGAYEAVRILQSVLDAFYTDKPYTKEPHHDPDAQIRPKPEPSWRPLPGDEGPVY